MILIKNGIFILFYCFIFLEGKSQDYSCVHKCFYLNESYKNYSVDSILNFVKPTFTEIDSFKNGIKEKNELYNYLGSLQKSTLYFYNKKRQIIKEIETHTREFLNIGDSVIFSYNKEGNLFTRTVYSSDDGIIPYIGFLEKYQYIGDTTIETDEFKMFKEDTLHIVVMKFLKDGQNKILLPVNNSEADKENKIETIDKDKNGNIISIKNNLGVTITMNKYDTKNRLILKLQYYRTGYLEQIDSYSYK